MQNPLRLLREASSATASPSLQRGDTDTDTDATDTTSGDTVDVQDCPSCDDGMNSDGTPCDTCDGAGWTSIREAELSTAARKSLPKSDFAIPAKAPGSGSYPIGDIAHARNALARSSGKPEEDTVKAAVYKRYPQLKPGSTSEADRVTVLTDEARRLREGRKDILATTHGPVTSATTSHGLNGFAMTLIKEGQGSTGYYTPAALREFVESKRGEGMQAYADHPSLDQEANLPERSVRDLVGTWHDHKIAEAAGKTSIHSIFVPIKGPGYEWINTLAEAASSHPGPKPLAGVSLYGESEGDFADLPDGTYGYLPARLMPSSGDIVTNAGAGGGFARELLESLRRARGTQTTTQERITVNATELQSKIREAHGKLAAADTDEKRAAALGELDQLANADIDTPEPTVEALTESAPALLTSLREAAATEAAKDVEGLREQNRELALKVGLFAQDQDARRVVREAEIAEPEQEWFVNEIKTRNLREADSMKAFVEAQIARDQRIRESFFADTAGVEGFPSRTPSNGNSDHGAAALREAGLTPVQAAA